MKAKPRRSNLESRYRSASSERRILKRRRLVRCGDGVEECSGDAAAPAARRPRHTAFAVGHRGKRLVSTGRRQRGVMEFVSADERSARADDRVGKKPRGAVAEMQLAIGEAC